MFNFTHVLNVTTKQRYYIDRAELQNDGGYDESPDGGNFFQIDLQPESPEESPILNVDLYIPNYSETPQISKNLDSKTGYQEREDGVFHEEMMDALIEGKTLIVTTDKESR